MHIRTHTHTNTIITYTHTILICLVCVYVCAPVCMWAWYVCVCMLCVCLYGYVSMPLSQEESNRKRSATTITTKRPTNRPIDLPTDRLIEWSKWNQWRRLDWGDGVDGWMDGCCWYENITLISNDDRSPLLLFFVPDNETVPCSVVIYSGIFFLQTFQLF